MNTVLPPGAVGTAPDDGATRPLAALQDGLELVLHLRQPPPQVGVLGLQLRDALQKLLPLIHTGRIVGKNEQGARGSA